MNIVFVTPEFITEKENGGLGTYVFNMSTILSKMGHHVIVIVESTKSEDFYFNEKILIMRVEIDYSVVNTKIPTSIYRRRISALNRRLKEIIDKNYRIDVVQYPNYFALALERPAIPCIVRVSSDAPLLRAANRLDFDTGRKYDCSRPVDYLEDIALMNADAVFGPSVYINSIIRDRTGKRIETIESPSLIDEMIGGDKNRLPKCIEGKKFILTFGTLAPYKGICTIGRSIFDVLSASRDVCWAFAGRRDGWRNSDGGYIDSVDYLIECAKDYSDRVVYLGKVDRNSLKNIIIASLFCVLPSQAENFSNACIEAMSCNKVVIGTRDAGFDQLIEDGQNGFLINAGDNHMLVKTVLRVLNADKNRLKEIEECAGKVKDRLNPIVISERVLDIYKRTKTMNKRYSNIEYYTKIVRKYNESLLACGEPYSEVEKLLL